MIVELCKLLLTVWVLSRVVLAVEEAELNPLIIDWRLLLQTAGDLAYRCDFNVLLLSLSILPRGDLYGKM